MGYRQHAHADGDTADHARWTASRHRAREAGSGLAMHVVDALAELCRDAAPPKGSAGFMLPGSPKGVSVFCSQPGHFRGSSAF
jgi:hypothetical protein